MTEGDAASAWRRRVPPAVVSIAIVVLAIVGGIAAGAFFALHAMPRRPAVAARPVPGEFVPAEPRAVGEPSRPVPMPSDSAALAIGFLDEKTNVAVPRRVVTARVGECVVARVQPRGGSAYHRLVGGERWAIAGRPQVEVRPGDAPGYCLSWSRPSGAKGYAVAAAAVVADDAGRRALGSGTARVVVRGSPKPKPAPRRPAKPARPASSKPEPEPSANDQ